MTKKAELINFILKFDDSQIEDELNELSEEELRGMKMKIGLDREKQRQRVLHYIPPAKMGGFWATGKKRHRR